MIIRHGALKSIFLSFLLLISVGLGNLQAAKASANKPSSDVRVLVDMSGSMKQNDPDNLRVPAVQLMSNLLPPDSQAGIWTFGQYVNMLVPLARVDNEWKKKAVESSKKINSLGLFTNIGGAMEHASFGWKTPDQDVKRSLILLTDGVVDVSKDAAVNAAARRKVIQELLPLYKAAGITIHTIALSGDADEKLLATMAAETDGWYQKVDNASELQKVFLKIFEQATERDSLPLTDNKFSIDDQIDEFTVLVFKTADSKPTLLEQPDGEQFDAAADNAHLTWFESADYDLITINRPMVGEWRVHADIDPDNRVLIVSNLKMKSSSVANNLLANEKFSFNMHLEQEGETVTETDFLKLIQMKVELNDEYGNTNVYSLNDDGEGVDAVAGDGIYSIELTTPSNAGITQVSAWVESPTFQRMRQMAINVFDSPVKIEVELSEGLDRPHKLMFNPIDRVSKAFSLQIDLEVELPDGTTQSMQADFEKGYRQFAELDVIESGGEYSVQLNINGETPSGRQFNVAPPVYKFTSNDIRPEDVPEEEPVEEEKPDLTFYLIVGLGVNIVLIILGWLVARILKKRNLTQANKMSEQLG